MISSDISGLDLLLRGGFVGERIDPLVGVPSPGKTLLWTEFLSAGLRAATRFEITGVKRAECAAEDA